MNDSNTLPGILKTTKSNIKPSKEATQTNSSTVFVGFNATHVHLDTSTPQPPTLPSADPALQQLINPTLNTLNLNAQTSGTFPKKSSDKQQDSALAELRSYTSLMDEYSLHNFMIWNGITLRDTPEFQSYHRTYKNQWSYIETIIVQLEKLMKDNCIKLAIISGAKVVHYSLLNLSYLQLYQLLDCVTNADQIRPQLSSFSGDSQDQILRATIKIQTLGRRWFAIYRYKNLKKRLVSAIVIQSIIRRYVQRCRAHTLQQQLQKNAEILWKNNFNNLFAVYNSSLSGTGGNGVASEGNTRYLLILIPTISASEFIRLNMTHLHGLQNSLISSLYLLADPRIDIIYVTPCAFSSVEKNYINKFLSLMGINTLPNRLKFIVPDLTPFLPPTIPVSHMLWYSSATLRKLKSVIKLHTSNVIHSNPASASTTAPNKCHVMMFSSEISWIEKKIAIHLGINMMSPEPIVATEFSSHSQSKRLFMECNMNIPIGAHDIYNEEDLLIALTRLISSNLSISRWIIRLNVDYNNESTIILDTNRLPIVASLKVEQQMLMNSSNQDTECWYERHVQLNARKRILHQLKEVTLPELLSICRDDIYPSWSHYLGFLSRIGVVIEAEPPLLLGRVEVTSFVSPVGSVHVQNGSQLLHDEYFQKQGIIFPQTLIHPKSLEGASKAIGLKLYDNYGVTGFVTISYIVYRDAYDNITRLWATGLKFGLNPSYCAIGTLAQLTNPFNSILLSEHPLLPPVVEGRCCVYIPTAIHPPLSSSRDDVFFKLCKMNGISYDAERKTGVLFFMVDSLVGQYYFSLSLD